MRIPVLAAAALVLTAAAPAAAQRFPFERTFALSAPATLEVSTERGRIEIVAGEPGRVVVAGMATVRVGWDVPADAVDIAKRVAAAPPIEQAGAVVRARDPESAEARRAVTVSYQIRVPPDTIVRSASESGETTVRGVAGPADVRTQSGAITVADLSGRVEVTSGSGAVDASDIAGPLSITTSSAAVAATGLGSSLRVRTQSGAVEAALHGTGDVDVETGSSGVTLRGVRGGLVVKTSSGRIAVQGDPAEDWRATTGSSAIQLQVPEDADFVLDAASRSGSVTAPAMADALVDKRAARGVVGTGGPTVRLRTGSGAIRVSGS